MCYAANSSKYHHQLLTQQHQCNKIQIKKIQKNAKTSCVVYMLFATKNTNITNNNNELKCNYYNYWIIAPVPLKIGLNLTNATYKKKIKWMWKKYCIYCLQNWKTVSLSVCMSHFNEMYLVNARRISANRPWSHHFTK